MTEPAKQRTTAPTGAFADAREFPDDSGRFAVRPADLPPPSAEAEAAGVLEPMAEADLAKPVASPPPVPPEARGHVSGMFESEAEACPQVEGDDDFALDPDGLVDALRPYYAEAASGPSVDLLSVETSSQQPLAHSSLTPPTVQATRRFPWVPLAVGIVLAFIAGAVAAFSFLGPVPVTSPQPARSVQPRPDLSTPATEQVAKPEAARPAPAPEPDSPVASEPSEPAPAARSAAEVAPRPAIRRVRSAAQRPARKVPAVKPADTVASKAAPVASTPRPVEPARIAAPSAPQSANAEQEPQQPALPEAPTRAQIVEGFGAVVPAARACTGGRHGLVTAEVTIAHTGRVSHAVVSGDFKGPEGSCIARAIRTARFPQFARKSLRVSYPFSL